MKMALGLDIVSSMSMARIGGTCTAPAPVWTGRGIYSWFVRPQVAKPDQNRRKRFLSENVD